MALEQTKDTSPRDDVRDTAPVIRRPLGVWERIKGSSLSIRERERELSIRERERESIF